MNNTKSVTESTFQKDVIESVKPVIVDFWAEWCGPCRALGPVIDQLATDYADTVDVVKIDVDANPRLAAEYGITSIPAVYLFSEGEVKIKIIGSHPKQYFEKEFESYLES